MSDLIGAMRELVVANRILGREGVVDAYGHVSIRHPDNPERYIMSCSRSPELVSLGDLMEFTLDGTPFDQRDRMMYSERHIHGAIYETRPDVMAVIHNHSPAMLPFGVTGTPLRPMIHTAALMGTTIPTWDIRDNFGDTNMLVRNMEQGRDLAARLEDNTLVLMRGHGSAVAAYSLQYATVAAIYAQLNASLQAQAMQMGDITFMTPGEVEMMTEAMLVPLSLVRAWEYFMSRANCQGI